MNFSDMEKGKSIVSDVLVHDAVRALLPDEGIDLRLPRLQRSEHYRTSGKTDVGWEEGFFGNVKFVPWTKFDDVVSEPLAKIGRLDALQLAMANLKLVTLRLEIMGEYGLKDLSKNVENDQTPDVGKAGFDDLKSGMGDQSEVNLTLTKSGNENADVDAEPNASIENHNPVQEVYTDETVTMGINNEVFVASLSLLRNLQDSGSLFFRTQSFSSELAKNNIPFHDFFFRCGNTIANYCNP